MICIPHEYYINTFGDNRLKQQNYTAAPLENAPFTEELFNGVTFLTQVLSAGGGWVWQTNMAVENKTSQLLPQKLQDIFEN